MQGGGALPGTARPVPGPSPTAPPLPRSGACMRGRWMSVASRGGRAAGRTLRPGPARSACACCRGRPHPRTTGGRAAPQGRPRRCRRTGPRPVHRRRPHRRRGVHAGVGPVPPHRPRPGQARPRRRTPPPRRRQRHRQRGRRVSGPRPGGGDRPSPGPAQTPRHPRRRPAKRMRRLVGMLARKGYPPALSYRLVKRPRRRGHRPETVPDPPPTTDPKAPPTPPPPDNVP